MNFQRFLLSGATGLAFGLPLAVGPQAVAQEVAVTQPPSSAEAGTESGIEVVTVTARRREEDLQEVPLSVTAFTPEQIDRAGVDDRTSLADTTPSLISITGGYPSEFAFFALRGQGPAFGSVPGVVSYFAEVPNTIGIEGRVGTYFDLANVQVLAGPQGTLFGKNATGGNILFEPQRPTNQYEGYVRAEVGNFNDQRLEGAINAPINDMIQLRVSGAVGRRDGYTIDVGPVHNDKDYDNLGYESARAILAVKPTDKLDISTIGRYYHSGNNGGGTVPFAFNPAAGALGFLVNNVFPGTAGAVADQNARGPRRVAYDLDQFSETDFWQVINQITYEINDDLRVRNIASYSDFRNIYGYDYDGTIFPIAGQGQRGDVPTNAVDTYSEELQLQGSLFDDGVDFATGIYIDTQESLGGGHFTQFPFSVLFGPIPATLSAKSRSAAVFGQATVDVGQFGGPQGLTVTGGYRYTRDHVSNVTVIAANPAVIGSGEFDYGSYNVTLDYGFTRAVHAYVTARNAFKSGGVNGSVPEGLPYHTFPPEELQDVEVGLKSEFSLGDVDFRANVAAYSGNYKNIQRTTAEVISGAVLNVTRSAAEGKIDGIEFNGTIVPFDGLTLDASYSWMQSEYSKVTDASAGAIMAGSPFPYTPENKFSLGATYETELGNLGTLVLNGSYTQQSAFSTGQTNASFVREIPGYGLLNLSVDLKDVGGAPVDLTLFANNVTDKTYATGTADFYNQPFGVATYTYGEPQMYGVRLRYRFG